MPPKRRGGVAAGGGKRARAPDWRETLFTWRGHLTLLDGRAAWAGTWVGGDGDAAPAGADFAASLDTFSCAGEAPPAAGAALDQVITLDDSTYLLPEGARRDAKRDDEHFIILRGARAAACGKNEFGAFVSTGDVAAGADGAAVLTLARRYVRDDDARAALRGADGARAYLDARAAAGAAPH
jgi:hypothetical protein